MSSKSVNEWSFVLLNKASSWNNLFRSAAVRDVFLGSFEFALVLSYNLQRSDLTYITMKVKLLDCAR